MSETNIPIQSLKSLLISTFSAISLAAIILLTVVWPAEYGIDPTGIGKALGVTALAPQQQIDQVEEIYVENEALIPVETGKHEATQQPVVAAIAPPDPEATIIVQIREPETPKIAINNKTIVKTKPKASTAEPKKVSSKWLNTVVIIVPAGLGLEYKFTMKKNAKLIYSWASNGTKLYYDFHGEPSGDKTGYFKSYQIKTANSSKGELIAPFTGVHGWYWENNTKSAVKVTLKTKGKYKIKGLISK